MKLSYFMADRKLVVEECEYIPHFALQNLDKIVLSLEAAQGFCQGKQLSESGEWFGFVRVEDELGNFLGIGEVLEGIIKPKVVLWEV